MVISPKSLYTHPHADGMLASRRQRPDFATGNHFSFTRSISDQLEYDTWAESIKTPINSFGRRAPDRKFGPWVRSIPLSNSTAAAYDDDSSNAASPPLWKSSSPESRPNISRAQMIAKYRQDMMDLVRNLPETAYELSLRDLVESPVSLKREKEADEEEAAALTERGLEDVLEMKKKKWKGREKRRKMLSSGSRSGIMDAGGFLLKLFTPGFLPVHSGSRRENSGIAETDSKFFPRPTAAAADGEWSNCEYEKRSNSNGSSNSSCGSRSRKRWKLSACFPCLYGHRRSRSREF